MIQTLTKTWWLMVLAGVFDASYALINTFMQRADGSIALRTFVRRGTMFDMGMLAFAAGACTIAAGICISKNRKAWLLMLNGIAFSTLGLILLFWRGPLAFRTIALLIVVMAISIGILAFATVRSLQGHAPDKWVLGIFGAALAGFALLFVLLGFGWIRPAEPASLTLWMGAFFGLSAICMLGLGLRLHGLRSLGLRSFSDSAPI